MSELGPPAGVEELDLEGARKLALVALHTRSAVVIGDAQGFVEWVNEAFSQLTGSELRQVRGKPIAEVLQPRGLDDVAVGRLRAQLARAEPARLELRTRRRDRTPLHLRIEVQPVRDAFGQPSQFLVMASDVTAERVAEDSERRLREEAAEAERRECLQVLAAGMARRYAQVLGRLGEDLDQLMSEIPEESPMLKRLREMRRSVLGGAALSEQMRTIAGQRAIALRSIDLSDLVLECAPALEALSEGRHVLSLDVAARLPRIRADAGAVRELLMQLVANGFEALGSEPGTVHIRTGRRDLEESTWAKLRPKGSLRAERCVFLEVSDTGPGLDPALGGRAFDPFTTTRAPGRGLGLASVLGLAQAHRAGVLLESDAGRGTRITVFFARPTKASLTARRRGAPRRSARPRRVVLVVEDEPATRESTQRALRRSGFRVLTVSGRDALELFREHADEIDAVLLAPTPAGPDALELLRRMRVVRPDARFLLTSPYSDEAFEQELAEEDIAHFLQKPYTPRELVDTLRRVLYG